MAVDTHLVWNASEILAALILLGAIGLMAKFYQESVEGSRELRNWKLITIGFAFYIGVKTQFLVLSNAFGVSIAVYPGFIVVAFGATLIFSAALVFIGFYGLIKDYL